MSKSIKASFLMLAGLCWIGFALFSGLCLFGYVFGGAGLQVFGMFFPPSSTTVLVGLFHFVGFSAVAIASFVIGIMMTARGVTSLQRAKLGSEE